MTEQTMRLSRNGWSPEETDMLWKEIRAAADTGTPLRGVFERMGQTLGRKPNSVRNYYYMQLRDQGGSEFKRAAPFETFTEEEIHQLLRQVLMARGRGQSVRACVMDLSGGDKARMLRYQNKYRSILRKKPAMIERVCEELKLEGLPCPSGAETAPLSPAPCPAEGFRDAEDPDIRAALSALASLARRIRTAGAPESDRLKVQRDLLLMQVEDLQLAAKAAIRDCKEFLGYEMGRRIQLLPEFSDALAGHVARLESVSG